VSTELADAFIYTLLTGQLVLGKPLWVHMGLADS